MLFSDDELFELTHKCAFSYYRKYLETSNREYFRLYTLMFNHAQSLLLK